MRPPASGIALTVKKELPLSAGQGGSAASAVAGAVAANALCGSPLPVGSAARRVSGGRSRPSPAGTSTTSRRRCSAASVSCDRWTRSTSCGCRCPPSLFIVLAHPSQRLRTADARAVLPAAIDRATAPASGGAGRRDRRRARVGRPCAARTRDRRPDRRAGARAADPGLSRSEGGRARGRRARRLDLRRRPDDVRVRRRSRLRSGGGGGNGGRVRGAGDHVVRPRVRGGSGGCTGGDRPMTSDDRAASGEPSAMRELREPVSGYRRRRHVCLVRRPARGRSRAACGARRGAARPVRGRRAAGSAVVGRVAVSGDGAA